MVMEVPELLAKIPAPCSVVLALIAATSPAAIVVVVLPEIVVKLTVTGDAGLPPKLVMVRLMTSPILLTVQATVAVTGNLRMVTVSLPVPVTANVGVTTT